MAESIFPTHAPLVEESIEAWILTVTSCSIPERPIMLLDENLVPSPLCRLLKQDEDENVVMFVNTANFAEVLRST